MHSFCCNPTHEGDDTSDKDNYGQKTRQLNDHLSNILTMLPLSLVYSLAPIIMCLAAVICQQAYACTYACHMMQSNVVCDGQIHQGI